MRAAELARAVSLAEALRVRTGVGHGIGPPAIRSCIARATTSRRRSCPHQRSHGADAYERTNDYNGVVMPEGHLIHHLARKHLAELAIQTLREPPDAGTFLVAMAVVALGRKQLRLGSLILDLDQSELDDVLEEYRGWKGLYREAED